MYKDNPRRYLVSNKVSLSENDEPVQCRWILDFTDAKLEDIEEFAKRSVIIRTAARCRGEVSSNKNSITWDDWKERIVMVKDLKIGERSSDPNKKVKQGGKLIDGMNLDELLAMEAKLKAAKAAAQKAKAPAKPKPTA